MECKSLRDSGQVIAGADVALFAASVDDSETNAKFAESLDLNYPILSDPKKKAAEAYGVLHEKGFAKRWTFYIDKDGILKHIDTEVSPATSGPVVLETLKKLGLAAEN